MDTAKQIQEGKTSLGLELGSTRIKAVLIGTDYKPLAGGEFSWENRFENGIWTYHEDEIINGIQEAYKNLAKNVGKTYGVQLERIGSIGISAMMHGYLVLGANGRILVPFRTWRNSITAGASRILTRELGFHIPERYSIAHLYQAVLNREEHVNSICVMTTLAGYVHMLLTGKNVLGADDASGVFPVNPETLDYDENMLEKAQKLLEGEGVKVKLKDILPAVLSAGDDAGCLTEEGAALLDPDNKLCPGALFAPPEGDAGTGMTATNAVRPGTGNVSAGTSIFGMAVLKNPLTSVHEEIDMVVTPDGSPVAMVHCNNCSSEINAWVKLFGEVLETFGVKEDGAQLYQRLFEAAMQGEKDGGRLVAYNFLSGEHIIGLEKGCPMFVRDAAGRFNLPNFMRVLLLSSMGTLKIGFDLLAREEKVEIDEITGHGGLFKTPGVAQSILAAALNAPVSVMETAGEGGAWGMALLAAYRLDSNGLGLADFLDKCVFADAKKTVMKPDADDASGFEDFMSLYAGCLEAEEKAVKAFDAFLN